MECLLKLNVYTKHFKSVKLLSCAINESTSKHWQKYILNNNDNNKNNNNKNENNKRYKRRIKPIKKLNDEYYQNEIAKISLQNTSKYTNYIHYDLITNIDCTSWTRFSKYHIIKQAQICSLDPVQIFYCRMRIKCYLSYKIQSQIAGISETTLKNWFDESLDALNNNYAKPRLLNSGPLKNQYWTRDKIKANTPNFVYKLQNIDPLKEDKIVINQDSTYQYIQSPHTTHNMFKKTQNYHKHKSLIKVHIWGCTNGLPIASFVTLSDGHHTDSQIFKVCFDEEYVAKCIKYLTLKEKRNNKKSDDDDSDDSDDSDDEEMNYISQRCCFVSLEECKKILNLQKLIKIQDHLISDNGYIVNDVRKRSPMDKPLGMFLLYYDVVNPVQIMYIH